MAEPNPDDGLVPHISELYKRNPTEWHREAKKRTRVDATMEKLEEMQSSLERECSNDNDNVDVAVQEENNIVTGNENKDGVESSQVVSKGAMPSMEVKNVEYERDSKRSKLSSRR